MSPGVGDGDGLCDGVGNGEGEAVGVGASVGDGVGLIVTMGAHALNITSARTSLLTDLP